MSKLIANSLPAERQKGLTFAESFENSQKVVQNGGVATGSPVINLGATFESTNDKLSYPSGNIFNSSETSICVRFNPVFDTDANIQAYLFDTTSGERYAVIKNNNAASNSLAIWMGDTLIENIAEATYSPFWNTNQENKLIISGTSGNTSVWLNGNLILTADATAWTSDDPVDLHIGNRFSGGVFFQGEILEFKIFKALLTAKEVSDIQNNSTFNYRNKAVLDLPMDMSRHDPTNVRTLDVRGNHAQFGDGSTPSSYPTKLATHGYDFASDHLRVTPTGVFNSNETSIVCEFYPDFETDDGITRFIYDTTSSSEYSAVKVSTDVLHIELGGTLIQSIAEAVYKPYWRVGQKNVLIVVGDSVNNLTNVWLNDGHILTDDSTAWTPADPALLTIGANAAIGSAYDGKITGFQVYPFLLSDVQVEDILISSNHKINDI